MQKIKTVLRLAGLGLSQRQIALSCHVGQATVSDYLRMAAAAGIEWPDVADWDEDRLRASLAPASIPAWWRSSCLQGFHGEGGVRDRNLIANGLESADLFVSPFHPLKCRFLAPTLAFGVQKTQVCCTGRPPVLPP